MRGARAPYPRHIPPPLLASLGQPWKTLRMFPKTASAIENLVHILVALCWPTAHTLEELFQIQMQKSDLCQP